MTTHPNAQPTTPAAQVSVCTCQSAVEHQERARADHATRMTCERNKPRCMGEYRSKRKPCSDYAGYVASRRSGPVLPDGKRGWCVLLDLENGGDWSGSAEDGGRWLTLCDVHGTLVQHTSQRAARATMKSGTTEFCDECREQGAR